MRVGRPSPALDGGGGRFCYGWHMPHRLLHDDVFRRLCRAREHLCANHAATPRVAELARTAGVSRFHFLRLYRKAFGTTPHQHLMDLRLERARTLLASGNLSVTEVCMEVGFSSLGSFSALFARRVGVSPQRWRRRVWQVAQQPMGMAQLHVPWCFLRHFAPPGN